MMDKIRVPVVDDSAFMRRQISAILERAGDLVVVGPPAMVKTPFRR